MVYRGSLVSEQAGPKRAEAMQVGQAAEVALRRPVSQDKGYLTKLVAGEYVELVTPI